MSSDYRDVMSRLDGLRKHAWGWSAKCPAHQDGRQSLSIRLSPEGDLWLRCHAGCQFNEIIGAIGVNVADCFAHPVKGRHMAREVAVYDYRDEQGVLLYQTVRFDPKDFRQRRADGTWGLGDTRRVLYRLPEMLGSDRAVLVVEGEKDVDRLRQEGFIATCNPMGAGKWSSEYSASLKGRNVVIIPDNDKPGLDHADLVQRSLRGVAKKSAILRLPDTKDVSDWFNAGGQATDLRARCIEALTSKLPTAAELIAMAKQMDAPAKWLAVRELLADLEAK